MNLNNHIIWDLKNPLLIAGPCVIEGADLCFNVASYMQKVCDELGWTYIFKASYKKANRTSLHSFTGLGTDESLRILDDVRTRLDVPVITDVHETVEVSAVSQVADLLQIPAFLCRQTDLIMACGQTGKPVNIKKGQFMAPAQMQFAVQKVQSTGNQQILLTERGSFFGYGDLVVDMRSIPVMQAFAPVIFDVTHSVQQPGGLGEKSGGNRQMAPVLARAAAAAGANGFFIETHPHPDKALSDGPNMIPLGEMKKMLIKLDAILSC